MKADIKPFLKWAGGKRWLAQSCPWAFQLPFDRLVEPFAGSAAIFFHLQPTRAWLNDINVDLVESYRQIQKNWKALFEVLEEMHKRHSKSFYYLVRESAPVDPLYKSARFIYLNRTCFNGIYRVNRNGIFNVPKGTKSTVLFDDDDFDSISILLEGVRLTSFDFESVVEGCGKGDLVFVDPPYTVRHNLNGFLKYNEKLFSWADQVRLRDRLLLARDRGASVIVSNADHESILELYSGSRCIHRAERHSVIAASSRKRKATTELLIYL